MYKELYHRSGLVEGDSQAVAPLPMKQHWRTLVNLSQESPHNCKHNHNKTKRDTLVFLFIKHIVLVHLYFKGIKPPATAPGLFRKSWMNSVTANALALCATWQSTVWLCWSGRCLPRRIIVTAGTISAWRNYRNAYRWLCSRLQYLLCVSIGDTTILHGAIDIYSVLSQTNPVRPGFKRLYTSTKTIPTKQHFVSTKPKPKPNLHGSFIAKKYMNWLQDVAWHFNYLCYVKWCYLILYLK